MLTALLKASQCQSHYHHRLVTLDVINPVAKQALIDSDIPFEQVEVDRFDQLLEAIQSADIVLVHWWNHPLLNYLIMGVDWPECRLIFWSHVSGLHPPYVLAQKYFEFADRFVFTTPLSLQADYVKLFIDQYRHKTEVVWSTGGTEHVWKAEPKAHQKFTVGYVGTVEYSKIHGDILDICEQLGDECEFVFCGGDGHLALAQACKDRGMDDFVTFYGVVDDITPFLVQFDVFGYPLNPYHFGTCDQSLAEAMACGIPPVVLSNPMEQSIVSHQETGLVAKDVTEYVEYIRLLKSDAHLRGTLGAAAKRYARTAFSLDETISKWEAIFDRVVDQQKHRRVWPQNGDDRNGDKPPEDFAELFLESIGPFKDTFLKYCQANECTDDALIQVFEQNPLWRSPTRGSVNHYLHFFPSDLRLQQWSKRFSMSS